MKSDFKNNLRLVVNKCRIILEEEITRRVLYYGFQLDGNVKNIEYLDYLTPTDIEIRNKIEYALKTELIGGITQDEAIKRYIKHASFTYLNRFAALRALETRGLIIETIIRRDKYGGRSLREMNMSENNPSLNNSELLKNSLVEAFIEVSQEIKVLFDIYDMYSLVFPNTKAILEIIKLISEEISEEIWKKDDIIGWIYQYFNEANRQEIRKSKKRHTPNDIPIVSQFYTPDWIVKTLVDNSVGQLWYEMNNKSKIKEFCRYNYSQSTYKRKLKSVKEIRVIDPACGSGHFLVYAFDVLFFMYRESEPGISESEIPLLILKNNLYGVDIDLRATQLTALSLYLKAKTYNPTIRIQQMNIVCADIRLSNDQSQEFLKRFNNDPSLKKIFEKLFIDLSSTFSLGSLLQIHKPFESLLALSKDTKLTHIENTNQQQVDSSRQTRFVVSSSTDEGLVLQLVKDRTYEEMLEELKIFEKEAFNNNDIGRIMFVNEAEKSVGLLSLLTQKYDAVVMNPPYGPIPIEIKDYLKQNYPRTYYDYYSVFLEQAINLLQKGGLIGALVGRPLMVIKTMEKVREEILKVDAIPEIVMDLGFKTMQEANARLAAIIARKVDVISKDNVINFFSLNRYDSDDKRLVFETALKGKTNGVVYSVSLEELSKVPGTPYAYWAPSLLRHLFEIHPPLDKDVAKKSWKVKISDVKAGLQTGDDKRFKRFWWEVNVLDIAMNRQDTRINKKWVTFSDEFYLFYFYADFSSVVNWRNDGEEIRNSSKGYPRSSQFYFKPGLTWSAHMQRTQVPKLMKMKRLPFRILPPETIFGIGAMGVLVKPDYTWTLLAICCSKLIFSLSRMISSENKQQTAATALLPIAFEESNSLQNVKLTELSIEAHDLLMEWSSGDETSVNFVKPHLINFFNSDDKPNSGHPLTRHFHWSTSPIKNDTAFNLTPDIDLENMLSLYIKRKKMVFDRIRVIQSQIDNIVYDIYKVPDADRKLIEDELNFLEGSPLEKEEDIVELENSNSQSTGQETNNDVDIEKDYRDQIERLLSFFAKKSIEAVEDGIVPTSPIFLDNFTNLVLQEMQKYFGVSITKNLENSISNRLGMTLSEWLENDFFEFHMRLYRKRPIIWQLTSKRLGKSKDKIGAFSCFLSYRKLTSDTILKIKGLYLSKVLDYYKSKKDKLDAEYSANKNSENNRRNLRILLEYERIKDKLEELELFDSLLSKLNKEQNEKILTNNSSWEEVTLSKIIDKGWRPNIDYGVRLNIEPLRQYRLVPSSVDKI